MSWEDVQKSLHKVNELLVKNKNGLFTKKTIAEESGVVTKFCELINERTVFSEVQNEKELFSKVLENVLRLRLLNQSWRTFNSTSSCDENWVMVLVHVVRVLARDQHMKNLLFTENLLDEFLEFSSWLCLKYLDASSMEMTMSVRALLSIIQKLCSTPTHTALVADLECQKVVTILLASKDMSILQATFQILGTLCEHSEVARQDVCQSNALDQAVTLLADSDLVTQKFCASLLRVLCLENEAREQLKVYDGLPVLISLLSTRNVRLQWHLAWTLSQLAEDSDTANELGQRGIVQLILAELSDTKIIATSEQNCQVEDRMAMLTGLNAVLAQLCRVDSNAYLIVQNNGVYVLARLLILQIETPALLGNTLGRAYELLQCSTLRVLRLLFSLERNRLMFKRLFPAQFFSSFIDIGHYILELPAYQDLVAAFRKELKSNDIEVAKSVESVNTERKPLGFINQYAVLDQMGAGAFGCVYRVKKRDKNQHYALKEIFMHQGTLDRESRAQDKSFGEIINEVKMIKEKLRHPNVVRYRRVFLENEKLYIVMDLIDGASLKEHINSAKEKGLKFGEDRIWHIVVQIVLGLRYLHKDKKIIHRDLKPNNIMLAEGERVVITDFGLAKYRGDSYLKSNAGTILYSCPEMLQDQPYGDKADVWSFGCCIYEMCMLVPPFYSTNMLQLATIIVESKYVPVNKEQYSEELTCVVDKCLTADATERPDIISVSSLMAGRLLTCLDEVFCAQYELLQSTQGASAPANRSAAASVTVAKRTTFTSSSGGDDLHSPEHSINFSQSASSVSTAASAIANKTTATTPKLLPKRVKVPPSQVKSAHAVIVHNKPRMARVQTSKRPNGRSGGDSRDRVVLPNISRSKSSTLVTNNRLMDDDLRIQSASSLVCLPANLLQPITDPILSMLSVLHNVIYICQLPVEHSGVDHRRRVIEQFKRRLFMKDSSAAQIKAELRKLMNEASEPVALNLGYSDYRVVVDAVELDSVKKPKKRTPVPHITYEQLYACIVSVLASRDPAELPLERPMSRLMTPRTQQNSH